MASCKGDEPAGLKPWRAMPTADQYNAGLSRLTRNQAAYIAGNASSVRTVATTSPPMMAIAIGNMKRRGITKSDAVRLSGVDYEIVDRYYRGDAPAGKGEKDD